ncbi:hypothetical protein [Hymenobacter weizhouensis]|uniref:hypothetical protein n=1 Tax=Hymenobacter sp. YIM 151500-1 TaxID=2987689 RepID=UPI002227EE1B|nr:hypothetical protein [Hymenobacter sp. YIM 151500-1]UYZ64880.1 hypothetical protein OIS53_08520 [Hymenobacter sp. YIM 151500-1]
MRHYLLHLLLPLTVGLVLGLTRPAAAHGGEDHGGAAAPSAAAGAQYFSVFTDSDQFEVLLRYEPLKPGEPAHLRLFLADFATNAPVRGAKLTLTAPEDGKLAFQTTEQNPGDYRVETTFPSAKTYSLTVQVVAPDGRADLLLLEGVAVGKELLPQAAGPAAAAAPWKTWQLALLLAGVFLAGVAAAALVLRRRRVVSSSSTSSPVVHEHVS